jgi:insulysin
MCFLGSEKYPGENEYKSYLAQHGGRSNASTSMHLTTYKFEILADYAEHALDVFANFFTAPLFTKSGTGREVNAVDSENSKNLTADVRRRLQILKDLGDPNHYYTKFSTGNSQTLPTETPEDLERVREALLAFHKLHYRPENLTVVVAGPQSLDQLQAWLVPMFASMEARAFPSSEISETENLVRMASEDAPPYHFSAPEQDFRPAFQASPQWPLLYIVKPVRSMRRLTMMFPMPATLKSPDQSPSSILSHLLGHEGPSGPFAVLQNAGLLSSLSAGSRVSAPDFSLFQVDMSLTDEGERQWKAVADVIFQHCRLIAEAAEQAQKGQSRDLHRIWGEKATLHAMFFDQTSPSDVYSLAPSLSSSIVVHGTEESIAAGSMLKESEDTLPLAKIADFAKQLVSSNCMIERCSEFAWNEIKEEQQKQGSSSVISKEEKWYGIVYLISNIDSSDVARWERQDGTAPFIETKQLALPKANRYIPRSLELCPELPEEARLGPRIDKEIDPPNLILEDPKIGRLWHRLDDRYALPKSSLSLLVRNAAVENIKIADCWEYSASASVHSALLSSIFSDALAQETYDADLAGLHWSLSLSSDGIRIAVSGFSDRLPDLAQQILTDFFLSNEFIKESYFLSAKDKLVRNLRTYFQSRRADSHSMYYRDFLLASVDNGLEESLDAVESATLESVISHHQTLLENSESVIDCLFAGNVSEKEAKRFFQAASDRISKACAITGPEGNPSMWIPGLPERRLDPGTEVELHFSSKNEQEENGAVVATYQSPIPGFRGEPLSSTESLRSSASIRLISHMLREPLFDELRTKQTLGYIVSSYFDIGCSIAPQQHKNFRPWTANVDFIVISVLSRKVPPPEVLRRIDDFLIRFRDVLVKMPDSEIADFASALSSKLLQPIQKLGIEVSNQYSKIKRFAPEVIQSDTSMPWDNSKIMASTIRSLCRQDILGTWDRMMLPYSRARVVSCVYGTTFPLQPSLLPASSSRRTVIVNSLAEIAEFRSQLGVYDNTPSRLVPQSFLPPSFVAWSQKPSVRLGGAAFAVGAAGFMLANWVSGRNKKSLASK